MVSFRGVKRAGRAKVTVRVDEGDQLGQEVAEEAAGQSTHDKGAHAAQAQQSEEVGHGALGLFLRQHHHRGQHHQ